MHSLSSLPAHRCMTAAAFLIKNGQLLCVKHRKLGMWFAPGGHIEANEMPDQAAERECLEETGIEVQAVSALPVPVSKDDEYRPVPFASSLHWVAQAEYKKRQADPARYRPNPLWPRGCEQHLCELFLVKPLSSSQERLNEIEATEIGWFSAEEIDQLETTDGFKVEARLALESATRLGL